MSSTSPNFPLRPVLDLLEERECTDTCRALSVPMSTVEDWVAHGLTEDEARSLAERLEVEPVSLWPSLQPRSPAEWIAECRSRLGGGSVASGGP